MLTQGVNHPNANRAYPHALDGLDNFSVELLVNEVDVLVDDRQRVQELEGWGLLWVTSWYRWGAGGGGDVAQMQPILPLQRGRKGGPPYCHPFTLQGKVQSIPEVSCTELLQQGDVQRLECLCQLLVVAEVPATFGGSLAGINQGCANVLGHKGLPLLHTGAHLGTLKAEPPVDRAREAGSVRPVRQREVCASPSSAHLRRWLALLHTHLPAVLL